MTDRESKIKACKRVKSGNMIGETKSAQTLIPIKLMMIWLNEPVETPKSAPVIK
jgi:myo-inositol catabolism protein IolC